MRTKAQRLRLVARAFRVDVADGTPCLPEMADVFEAAAECSTLDVKALKLKQSVWKLCKSMAYDLSDGDWNKLEAEIIEAEKEAA